MAGTLASSAAVKLPAGPAIVVAADAIKIKEVNTSIPLPIFCKKYSEYDEITQLSKDINKQKEALLKKIISDIHNKKLKADEIIALLFEYGREIEITEEIIQNGKTRYDLGNPPGKKGSYGDALNWESLLKEACQPHLGDTYDLCFISDDKDYISAIDSDNFNSFLEEEWKEKKQTCIYFYKDLSSFFADKFSEEKLAIDFERDILVKNFVNSSSFHNTRENLKRLYKLGNFSKEQLEKIVNASINNTQILWISSDDDINEMLYYIIEHYDSKNDEEKKILAKFKEKIPKK